MSEDIFTLVTEGGYLAGEIQKMTKKLDKIKASIRKVAQAEKVAEFFGDGFQALASTYRRPTVIGSSVAEAIIGINPDSIDGEKEYTISGHKLALLLGLAGYTLTKLKKVFPDEAVQELVKEDVKPFHTISFKPVA